ncbi:MAG: IS3 family transposase [Pseudonocardiaceae bacterium]
MHTEFDGQASVRRVWAELVARGVRVGAKRVWRLMAYAAVTREPGRRPLSQVNVPSMPRI